IINEDIASVKIYRNGLKSIMEYIKLYPDIFPKKAIRTDRMPNRGEKEIVWDIWKSLLDYYLALDSIGKYHKDYDVIEDKNLKRDSFLTAYSVFLAQYRFALDFIKTVENKPSLAVILNEPVPEIGMPEKTYDKFKFRFLNILRATEFIAMKVSYKYYGESDLIDVKSGVEEDSKIIFATGQGHGEILTLKNAVDIIAKAGFTAWFPVQAGISNMMGDIKVKRKGISLISGEQIKEIYPRLLPGDILLERREWYLSNIGLPGFWTHPALFIGTPDEREKYFDDPEVKKWTIYQGQSDGNFESLIKSKYPAAYELCTKRQEENHAPRILEAIGEGVSFTTIEHSAYADSLVVLRPKLTKKEKAIALLRAFHYSGRPYDFNFDFLTDAAIVCSELIYKSYEPSKTYKGLFFPLERLMGRQIVAPNEIAHQFDADYGTGKQQLDFILFFDGDEKENKAIESTLDQFRKSWKRPKWHILVQ
ncbi:hypothetical protein HY745_05700, partial [Candidatus Desantisbacteria bacterium]|nr:hypothetical protein [Candidatus Desantisbacteria bacterium]